MVEILSMEAASDLRRLAARRLSSGQVVVTSEIIGAPSNVTTSDIQGAVIQMGQEINRELAASTSLTVSGLTATVTPKEMGQDTAPTSAPTTAPTPAPTPAPESPQ